VEREDVRVGEPGGDRDLALESFGADRRRDVRQQHLERDATIVLAVAGEKDDGCAATSKLALEGVAFRQRGSKSTK
jgi:hypothetical protein